jgi:ATP-dependent protease ClpP protease subunit
MNSKRIYINFFDSINENKVKTIMSVLSGILDKKQPDEIYFLFSSPGGHVDSGIVLYNFLRSLPIKIIMHNTGSIDSIANVIFLAAETRLTSVHSSFLFHGVTQPFNANTALTKNQLHEAVSGITISENKISGIIAEHTKLTIAEIGKLFLQGESKDATFALDKGIVGEILNPKIPKSEGILSFNIP